MNASSQAEFESVLQGILAQTDEELLRTFDASGAEVYGKSTRSLFGAHSKTVCIPAYSIQTDRGGLDFAEIRHLVRDGGFRCMDHYALAA